MGSASGNPGTSFGSKDFVTELEAKLERILDPQKRGRKPKHSDQGTEADCVSASALAVSAEKPKLVAGKSQNEVPHT